jgi:hypothetical protein
VGVSVTERRISDLLSSFCQQIASPALLLVCVAEPATAGESSVTYLWSLDDLQKSVAS